VASSNKKSVIRVLQVDEDLSMLEDSKQILMDMGNFDIDTACCVDDPKVNQNRKENYQFFDIVLGE